MTIRQQTGQRLALVAILAALTSACGTEGASGTGKCTALAPYLPSWSIHDTEQSKAEGAAFLDVFDAVCGDLGSPAK